MGEHLTRAGNVESLPRATAKKLFQEMIVGGGGLPLPMTKALGGNPPADWPPLVRTVDIEFDDPQEYVPVKKEKKPYHGGGSGGGTGVPCPMCGWINFGKGTCECMQKMTPNPMAMMQMAMMMNPAMWGGKGGMDWGMGMDGMGGMMGMMGMDAMMGMGGMAMGSKGMDWGGKD